MTEKNKCENCTRESCHTSNIHPNTVPYATFEAAMYYAEKQEKKKSRWMIAFFVALSLLCSVVIGTVDIDHNSTNTDSNEVTYESTQYTCDSR